MTSYSFKNLHLSSEILSAIETLGYHEMTPIQAQAIPLLLEGLDLVGRSQTGSGKTAAFALPVLQKIKMDAVTPQALILAPTRELCDQILQEIRKFSKGLRHIQTLALVGGQSSVAQIQSLKAGAQIVVGTPGRTLEFLKNGNLDSRHLKTLILDEADRMLDEGFTEEVTKIIELLPSDRQTVFFSATFPASMEDLSLRFQKNPKTISVISTESAGPQIEQFVYSAEKPEKIDILMRILQQHPANSVLIFCRTKLAVAEINDVLNESKFATRAIHGDLDQNERNQTMALFRSGSLRVLVATDVAARGIDVDHLELVINFDLPSSTDIYLHRIGRTGRAGKTGCAVSIADAFEASKVEELEKMIGRKFNRPELKATFKPSLTQNLQQPKMKTIYISGGKKDKLRPGDILGALTASPQPIASAEIGKIETHDTFTYVAVSFAFADRALNKLIANKLKGRKFKASYIKLNT